MSFFGSNNIRDVPGQLQGSRRIVAIPGHLTNAADADLPANTADNLRRMLDTARRALTMQGSASPEREPEYELYAELLTRKSSVESAQTFLRSLYRRFDNLYHPTTIDPEGGADHWPEGRPKAGGKAHVSVNAYRAYVDIPASLQAVTPVINYVPGDLSKSEREAAERRERLYFTWRDEVEMDLLDEDICRIRALYGDVAVKVVWDPVRRIPLPVVLESIENLYLGYGDNDYKRLDWAVYCYRLSPQAVEEDFGLRVDAREQNGGLVPVVYDADHADPLGLLGPDLRRRRFTEYEQMQVEVYDYWYKKPVGAGKAPAIYNAIFVGNHQVKAPTRHREYDDLPYVIIPNSRVPGLPYGKSDLYDVEQILREKDERLTQAAQMIQSAVGGQRWQLVGAEAPDEVPPGLVPQPNKVIAPGPGNRVEPITPWMPELAIEAYLKRLDEEATKITGVNDLLLGLSPAPVLGSSKAVNALIAQYESRINPSRKLLYQGYRRIWEMAAKVWERKDSQVRFIINGSYRLRIDPPELTPRDALETAQMAINLVQNRVWSLERAQDRTGVEDPGAEKNVIREEQTDASLNPNAVMTQGQLIALFRQLGLNTPEGSQATAGAQAQSLQTQAQLLDQNRKANPPAKGSASNNQPENAANPPGEGQPGNTPEGAAAGAGKLLTQTLLQNGQTKGRILTQGEV